MHVMRYQIQAFVVTFQKRKSSLFIGIFRGVECVVLRIKDWNVGYRGERNVYKQYNAPEPYKCSLYAFPAKSIHQIFRTQLQRDRREFGGQTA
jgi:hypothetical protein